MMIARYKPETILANTASIVGIAVLVVACSAQTSTASKKKQSLSVLSNENGVVVAAFDPNSDAIQTLAGSSDSGIANSSIAISPGSLAISTEITMEEGESMVGGALVEELGLDSAISFSEVGPAVAVQSSELVDASNPMSLAIPLSAKAMNLVETANYVVIYKVIKASEAGAISMGVIPTKDLKVSNSILSFKSYHFGSFQAALSTQPISEKVEVRTVEQISTRNSATELTGSWASGNCSVKSDDATKPESEMESMIFKDTQLLYTNQLYNSSDCSASFIKIQVEADYKIGEAFQSIEGAKKVDVTMRKFFVTPGNSEQASKLNDESFCGYAKWQALVPQELASLEECDKNKTTAATNANTCKDSPPKAGGSIYTIFKINGKVLQLGKSVYPNCGETDATRESILDSVKLIKK